ncbi:MAG: aspartyl/glutamyl-tRNA amidotransferase subunit C [Alphaproteobacteria bacterium]|nr:aspartyl/glutamyl-tRNA amidotransferase subunit C [Rickettsiales bacterium]
MIEKKLLKSIKFNISDDLISKAAKEIFGWIGILKEVETTNVKPLINPIDYYGSRKIFTRADIANNSISKEKLHKYTSCNSNGFFSVPKVVKK